MTAEEAKSYIGSFSFSTSKIGLDRTRELLEKLGEPQNKLKFVHVAGTNGKGSTCAMLAGVLRCSGYKTGLFTSPHLIRLNERMKINGIDISDGRLAELVEKIRPIAERMSDRPTQFELLTVMAMLYFSEENCRIAVMEVGLGGRYDSTNIISAPECSVICNIGLDHTEYLGDTIAQIASEKAGIIKPCCPAVCYPSCGEALEVFYDTASKLGSPIITADFSDIRTVSQSLSGQFFSWKDEESLFIPLVGTHQLYNAAVVLETVEILRKRGFEISAEALRKGLAGVVWQARFEVLRREVPIIVDGAHNPQCAEALADALGKFLPGKNNVFLIGVLADKDYNRILELLRPCAERFICITPPGHRALPAVKLAEILSELGEKAEPFDSIAEACEKALSFHKPVVVCGSLYISGQVKEIISSMI